MEEQAEISHVRPAFLSTQEYIGDLANSVRTCPDEEFVLESLGILGNLTITDVNFQQLLTDYDMLTYIKEKLQPGKAVLSCSLLPDGVPWSEQAPAGHNKRTHLA